jgi:hypothetical protein
LCESDRQCKFWQFYVYFFVDYIIYIRHIAVRTMSRA